MIAQPTAKDINAKTKAARYRIGHLPFRVTSSSFGQAQPAALYSPKSGHQSQERLIFQSQPKNPAKAE
jgi:hypothetical protein